MKTNVLIVLFCAITVCLHAQISVTTIPQVSSQFDCSKNQPDEDKKSSLKGQKLWVAPPLTQEFGYENFFNMKADLTDCDLKKLFSLRSKQHYGKLPPDGTFGTRSEDLNGKTFIVDDVLYKGILKTNKREPICVLMLTNTENPKDQCQFFYEGTKYPFVTLCHYDYLNETYPGKQYVVSSDYLMKKDAETGEKLTFSDSYYIVTFTEVTVTDFGMIKLVCSIDDHKVLCGPKFDQFAYDGNNSYYLHLLFYSIEEWNNYVELYGIENMKKVMAHNIEDGMPKELVFLAYGEPQSSSYIEEEDLLFLIYKDISFVIGPDNKVAYIKKE